MPLRIFLAIVLFAPYWLCAQSEHPLTGRHIAPVMGASGADWLERSTREREEQPELALDLMGIQKGMTIADVASH